MKIYEELARIQQELKAPKDKYNSFGKYSYRSAEGILEALKPHLNGMALTINDEIVQIGDRFYIKATVTLTNGEESVSATAYAREDENKKGMDQCQVTGACSSYARKYALNALLLIDDSKDSDDDSLSPKNPKNQPDEPNKGNGPVQRQNGPENGTVTTSRTIPQGNAKEPETPPTKPETPGAFIKRRIAELKQKDGTFDFMRARAALIQGGVIEDIPSATMNMKQAQDLIAAIEANCVKAS